MRNITLLNCALVALLALCFAGCESGRQTLDADTVAAAKNVDRATNQLGSEERDKQGRDFLNEWQAVISDGPDGPTLAGIQNRTEFSSSFAPSGLGDAELYVNRSQSLGVDKNTVLDAPVGAGIVVKSLGESSGRDLAGQINANTGLRQAELEGVGQLFQIEGQTRQMIYQARVGMVVDIVATTTDGLKEIAGRVIDASPWGLASNATDLVRDITVQTFDGTQEEYTLTAPREDG